MAFLKLQLTQKGRLASCECSKCGMTNYWHEWIHDGQAEDLKFSHCDECGSLLDPDTYWDSRSRNWYAGRYSAAGYIDCTPWEYGKNKKLLRAQLRALYGE